MQTKDQTNKIIEKRANGTKRVATYPVGPSRAQQQFKDDCNVNNIIAKFKATGSVTHVRNTQEGVYTDLVNLPNLMEAQQVVIAASKAFEAVPSAIRQRFNHDPQLFIDFLSDEKNNEEAVKLGLKTRQQIPKPDPVVSELQALNKNLTQKLKDKLKPKTTV